MCNLERINWPHTHLKNMKAVSRMIAELVVTATRRTEAIVQGEDTKCKKRVKDHSILK